MICLILLPVMAADRPDGYLLAAISWNDAVSLTRHVPVIRPCRGPRRHHGISRARRARPNVMPRALGHRGTGHTTLPRRVRGYAVAEVDGAGGTGLAGDAKTLGQIRSGVHNPRDVSCS
jgi:hypothetical protein